MSDPMLEDEDDFYSTSESKIVQPNLTGAQHHHDNQQQQQQQQQQLQYSLDSNERQADAQADVAALPGLGAPSADNTIATSVPVAKSVDLTDTASSTTQQSSNAPELSRAKPDSISAQPEADDANDRRFNAAPLTEIGHSATVTVASPRTADSAPDEAEAALSGAATGPTLLEQETNDPDAAPEYEADSSPYESSSDDSSDSSSEDDSSDDEYKLMDPREQARMLMADAGSDDEGGKKEGRATAPRTQNERIDEIVEMPEIEITADMRTEELGSVQVVIDNVALIKAKTSGEYQVLESSSVLCLENRKLIGVVAETIGRVEEPMYVVRFTNPTTLQSMGVEVGKTVYYVPSHSQFLFTKGLHIKGSDASNLHDEEVADNEMDFSDDEAEAAYKSSLKKQRQARKEAKSGHATDTSHTKPRAPGPARFTSNADNGPAELTYDDNAPADDLYTPLSRPTHLLQSGFGEHQPRSDLSNQPYRGRGRGGGGQGRGRGTAGRGRGYGGQNRDRPVNTSNTPAFPNHNHHSGFAGDAMGQMQHHSLSYVHNAPSQIHNHAFPQQPMSGYPAVQAVYSNAMPFQPQQQQQQQQQHGFNVPQPPLPPGSYVNPGFFYPAGQQTPYPFNSQNSYNQQNPP